MRATTLVCAAGLACGVVAGCGGAREPQSTGVASYPTAAPATQREVTSGEPGGSHEEPARFGSEVGPVAPPAPPRQPPATFTHAPPEPPRTLDEALGELAAAERALDGLFGAAGGAVSLASGSCAIACAALGSMRRAAAGLCELTGELDARCTEARGKLATNERRVSEAGCRCED
ncbi:MAG: hypothetical protein HY908_17030 [Myxococcales bacterium]|nr:hypothetical protein [Myxococcales bacterium]